MKIELYDESSLLSFLHLSGARIMQIFHQNYPILKTFEDYQKNSIKDIDDIFGKDSVWFTEKEKDGNSSLYSLIDFKGLNKLSSIHRAYMNGQFGALPNVIM